MTPASASVIPMYSGTTTANSTTVPTLAWDRSSSTTSTTTAPAVPRLLRFISTIAFAAVLGATTTSAQSAQTPRAEASADDVTVTELRAVIERVRDVGGLTKDETATLLGLSGGRHTIGNWEKKGAIRQANLRRLLEVDALFQELAARVPDVSLFLRSPLRSGWASPLELIADGKDLAVLGAASTRTREATEQRRTKLLPLGSGTVDYVHMSDE